MTAAEKPEEEEWLTKRELAAKLKISTRTIERRRIPPTMRVGGQNRYLMSAVRRHNAGQQERAAADVVHCAR